MSQHLHLICTHAKPGLAKLGVISRDFRVLISSEVQLFFLTLHNNSENA